MRYMPCQKGVEKKQSRSFLPKSKAYNVYFRPLSPAASLSPILCLCSVEGFSATDFTTFKDLRKPVLCCSVLRTCYQVETEGCSAGQGIKCHAYHYTKAVESERSVRLLALAGVDTALCLVLAGWKRMLDMLDKSEFEFLLLQDGLGLVLLELL